MALPADSSEQWPLGQEGVTPYAGSFLVHYLRALVYPDVSPTLLVWWEYTADVFTMRKLEDLIRRQVTGRRSSR